MALAIEHTNDMNDMINDSINEIKVLFSAFALRVSSFAQLPSGTLRCRRTIQPSKYFLGDFLQQAVDQNINRRLSTTCRMFSSWASCTENSSDRSPACPNLSASDIFWTDERSLFLMLVSKAKQMPSWESQRIQSSYR